MSANTDTGEFDPAQTNTQSSGRSGIVSRLILLAVLLVIALAYPIAVGTSHTVSSTISSTLPNKVWADRHIGASVELLEKEQFMGWAADQPGWHPQSRLTAMPAFQTGISDVISAFAGHRAQFQDSEQRDSDLWHAHTLLQSVDGQGADDRVYAAIEALSRFDGRKARALLDDGSRTDLLTGDVSLFLAETTDILDRLEALAAAESRGVFNRETVHVYYHAKGKLYAMGSILGATDASAPEVDGLPEALATAQAAFERAISETPLTVSNPQPGGFSFGGNDVMVLAFLTGQVRDELASLLKILESQAGVNVG